MKKETKNTEQKYQKRVMRHIDELRWLYMELYNNPSMFAELCGSMYVFYKERSSALKDRDEQR